MISLTKPQQSGFTLIELLIAAILTPIIIVTASNIFTSQVSSERRLIGAQSSENLRSRLSFLLESDISDGEKIIFPPTPSLDPDEPITTSSESTGCESSVGNLFTIAAPYLPGNPVSHACIIYSIQDGKLVRNGPPILRNGSLNYADVNVSQVVANEINIEVTSESATTVALEITLPGFIGAPARTYSVAYGTKNFRVGT
jgi:prepilin-type N-terminal cleavage/methylation domain-containing protein